MNKTQQEIINYMKDNSKKVIIFQMALEALEKYNIPVDVVFKHVIMYQNINNFTLKHMLGTIDEKN